MLADDLWLLAHSDTTGRPHLNTGTAAYGLAAALLGELVIEGKVSIQAGHLLLPRVPTAPPADALTHLIFEQLMRDPGDYTVRSWLAFLSTTAYDQIANRLVQAGRLTRQSPRGLFRRSETYVPADSQDAARPAVMLSWHLSTRRQLDLAGLTLASLVEVTGLTRIVLVTASAEDLTHLRSDLARLWPPLRELVSEVGAAIGDAVLSHRL